MMHRGKAAAKLSSSIEQYSRVAFLFLEAGQAVPCILCPSKGVVLGLSGLLYHWMSVVKGGGADRKIGREKNPIWVSSQAILCWLEVAHLSLIGLNGFSGLDICVSKVRLFLQISWP